jgi:hypothetical protein
MKFDGHEWRLDKDLEEVGHDSTKILSQIYDLTAISSGCACYIGVQCCRFKETLHSCRGEFRG